MTASQSRNNSTMSQQFLGPQDTSGEGDSLICGGTLEEEPWMMTLSGSEVRWGGRHSNQYLGASETEDMSFALSMKRVWMLYALRDTNMDCEPPPF